MHQPPCPLPPPPPLPASRAHCAAQLAEQDVLADMVSLLAVPSLLTLFAFLGDSPESEEHRGHVHGPVLDGTHAPSAARPGTDLVHLWVRSLVMLAARVASAHLSRAIFARKILYLRMVRAYR